MVTKPSSGSTVKVRDGGYTVSAVVDTRTGTAMPFTQSNGFLTITNTGGWDPYDTVFTVTTTGGRVGVTTGVTATANASASGHDAGNLVDGSYLNYWQNNSAVPSTITLDQGSSKHVAYLAINQREDSITQTASSSRRINGYTVQTSNDGSTFSTVKTGNLPNARGAQYIDINATARYVRLTVNSTYASSHQLKIDELWLASAYAGGSTPPPPPPSTIEAEASGNTFTGQAAPASCSACSGGAKVKFIGSTSANTVTVNNVNVSTAGSHQLTITYELNGSRTFDLSVNGGATIAVPLTGTDFNTPATATVTVTLNAGNNSIKFFNNSAWAPDLDAVSVS